MQTTLKNDICLLELEESITFSSVAQPVCFPEKNSRIDQVKLGEGPLCYVAGWGRIGEQLGTARILQETQVIFLVFALFSEWYVIYTVYQNSECLRNKKLYNVMYFTKVT